MMMLIMAMMIFRAGDDDVHNGDGDVQGGWGKQPSDDGLGDQDCLELRQNFGFASIVNVPLLTTLPI